jgi:hypothetical protein
VGQFYATILPSGGSVLRDHFQLPRPGNLKRRLAFHRDVQSSKAQPMEGSTADYFRFSKVVPSFVSRGVRLVHVRHWGNAQGR